jgi:hypothetical protein
MSYETTPTPKWRRWRELRKPIRVDTTVAVNTNLQPALDFERAARPTDRDDLTIERRFQDWVTANPGVMDALRRAALDQVAAGRRRIGVKALVEDLRRSPTALDQAGEPWRINNVFTSRIARRLAADPELAGKIELRALKAA